MSQVDYALAPCNLQGDWYIEERSEGWPLAKIEINFRLTINQQSFLHSLALGSSGPGIVHSVNTHFLWESIDIFLPKYLGDNEDSSLLYDKT